MDAEGSADEMACSVTFSGLHIQSIITIGQRLHDEHVISVRHVKFHTSSAIKSGVITFAGIKTIASPFVFVLVLKQRPPRVFIIHARMNPKVVSHARWKIDSLLSRLAEHGFRQ